MPEIKEPRTPVRQCAGCGAHFPKEALLRIVRNGDGVAVPDMSGTAQTRGIYVCRNAKCLQRALKGGRIQKQLKCPVRPDAFADLHFPET